jgi:hypothetical protein
MPQFLLCVRERKVIQEVFHLSTGRLGLADRDSR